MEFDSILFVAYLQVIPVLAPVVIVFLLIGYWAFRRHVVTYESLLDYYAKKQPPNSLTAECRDQHRDGN